MKETGPMDHPTVCIYHARCQDGFTAAWAVWKRFGNAVRYIPADYDTPPPPDLAGEHVVIVDFSFKGPTMRAIAAQAASVLVLDHHKSAQAELEPLFSEELIGGVFDMHRSGAMLAWDWYHGGDWVPALVQHVQDRDLWQFKLEGTREIAAALFSYDYSFDMWEILSMRVEDYLGRSLLVKEGSAIARARQKELHELLPTLTRMVSIGGHLVPAVNVPKSMGSEACDMLAKGHPFAAYYFDRADGLREFGLRARGSGIDVAAIAERYGGGGHATAAGFRAPVGWLGDVD
jgi:hypothetical protein